MRLDILIKLFKMEICVDIGLFGYNVNMTESSLGLSGSSTGMNFMASPILVMSFTVQIRTLL